MELITINSLKEYLKEFPMVVKIKRAFFKLVSIDQRHPVFKNKKYFYNKFKIDNSKNIPSLNLEQGLVFGELEGTPYFLKFRVGNFIENSVFATGMWEKHIAKIIGAYLQSTDGVMVDVGGNIGALTIPLAKKYPNSKFHAFEPHPEVFNDLLCNIAINKLSNVFPNNFAISNLESADLNFYAQKKSGNMGLSSTKLNSNISSYDLIKVRSIRIDDYFASFNDKVSIIKIDVQGGEIEVLESAILTVRKHKPIIIFEFEEEYFTTEFERTEARDKIVKYFDEVNYKLYIITSELNFYPELTLKHYFHGDILAVPISN